jgi:hypothetical protein
MRFFGVVLLGLWACASGAYAETPDYRTFPSTGKQLLLWVSSERGRTEPEVRAAQKLAAQGIEVWSLDPASAYFLPQLSRSMDAVPPQDLAEWIRSAQAKRPPITVYAVSRAAVPVLRAAALLTPSERRRVRVVLMYPNLYTVAEPLAAPDYLDVGDLTGLRVRVIQPRRSAATPWLPGLLSHLKARGAKLSHVILENLREGYWTRETPTDFEIAEGQRLDVLLLREINALGRT